MANSNKQHPIQLPIHERIILIRGEKILLDATLAELYNVETRVLIQAVKRNLERFPADFMFQLSADEFAVLKSQSVISSWGGRRTAPYAFTEQGVAMLSSVLRSKRAIEVNIEIMRTFVQLREKWSAVGQIDKKLSELERKYDHQFKVIFEAIREIMTPDKPPKKRRIGFHPNA